MCSGVNSIIFFYQETVIKCELFLYMKTIYHIHNIVCGRHLLEKNLCVLSDWADEI